MIHKFTRKSDFDLFLTVRSKGHKINSRYDANKRTYFLTYHEDLNLNQMIRLRKKWPNIKHQGVTRIIGWQSAPFSDSGFGLVFGHELTISEIGREFPGMADDIRRLTQIYNNIILG